MPRHLASSPLASYSNFCKSSIIMEISIIYFKIAGALPQILPVQAVSVKRSSFNLAEKIMPKRSALIIVSLLLLLVQACSSASPTASPLSSPPVAPTTAAVAEPPSGPTAILPSPVPTSTNIQASTTPTELPKVVTDIILEILHDEGSASVSDWTSNQGCVPRYKASTLGIPTPTLPNESHLKVAPDGSLEGTCFEEFEGMQNAGTLAGKIDWVSGAITFHLEAKAEYLYEGVTTVVTMVLDGSGQVGEADTATGESTWSLECRAAASGGRTCDAPGTPNELSLDVTGTSPWKMYFVRN